MKTSSILVATSLMILLPVSSGAQNINTPENFPDANFRAAVEEFMGVPPGGEFTAGEAVTQTGWFRFSGRNISDTTGVEYFTALTGLDCANNHLLSLDVSANLALDTLDCAGNQLASLDLSNNTALTYLRCSDNQLTSLDISVNTALADLRCGGNELTRLDVFNNTELTFLQCNGNQLTSLDVSNNTKLTRLEFPDNQLTGLDVSNNTALVSLGCWNNELTTLDVSSNTALTFIGCNSNRLTSLDVSKNTALDTLHCAGNQLTALDVSNNTALTELWCYGNQLTSLDLSNNTALTELRCYNNLLTSLDVSNNTALTHLNCPNNGLTSLDLSGNTALTDLNFANNQVTTLDLSNNTALTDLNCADNQLTTLDLSNNTALTWLLCAGNQLTSLDVSANTALTYLHCGGNQLTSLDLSTNTGLIDLECGGNPLTSLDLSSNTALTDLWCEYCELTNLDVSNNLALEDIHCRSNQLTSLDVSRNTALIALSCPSNELTSLDVSNNTALERLDCGGNQLTSISSLVASPGLGPGDAVDVRDNDLDCGDWEDVKILQARIGDRIPYDWGGVKSGFGYSPQRGFDPYGCTLFIQVPNGGELWSAGTTRDIVYVAEETITSVNITVSGDTGETWLPVAESVQATGTYSWRIPDVSSMSCLVRIADAANPDTADVSDGYFTILPPAENINTPANFPDPNFQAAVEEFMGVPPGGDFTAPQAAAQAGSLHCSNRNIVDMTGLHYFTGVTGLHCRDNQLSSLDVSNNIDLHTLYCDHNQLTSIAGLVANLGLSAGDRVDVRYNKLNCGDWDDVTALRNRIGDPVIASWGEVQSGFAYDPQIGIEPFDCPGFIYSADFSESSIEEAGLFQVEAGGWEAGLIRLGDVPAGTGTDDGRGLICEVGPGEAALAVMDSAISTGGGPMLVSVFVRADRYGGSPALVALNSPIDGQLGYTLAGGYDVPVEEWGRLVVLYDAPSRAIQPRFQVSVPETGSSRVTVYFDNLLVRDLSEFDFEDILLDVDGSFDGDITGVFTNLNADTGGVALMPAPGGGKNFALTIGGSSNTANIGIFASSLQGRFPHILEASVEARLLSGSGGLTMLVMTNGYGNVGVFVNNSTLPGAAQTPQKITVGGSFEHENGDFPIICAIQNGGFSVASTIMIDNLKLRRITGGKW